MRSGRSVFEGPNARVISGARHLGVVTAVAGIGVFLCARVGYGLSIPPTGVAVLWPGSGFVLAALIIAERRSWTAIIIGAAVGGFAADLLNGAHATVAAGSAVANCTESLAAAWLVTRIAGPRVALRNLREVAVLILGAAVVSNACTALLGAFFMQRVGFHAFWRSWFVWWTGDGMGMLIVAPFLLTWADVIRAPQRPPRRAVIGAATSLAAIGILAYALMSSGLAHSAAFRADTFLFAFPLVLWVAVRFGPWGASSATLILSAIVIWLTAHGAGPFAIPGESGAGQAQAVDVYLALASVCALIPASMRRERQLAEETLRRSHAQLSQTGRMAHVGGWQLDVKTQLMTWTEEVYRIFEADPVSTPTLADMLQLCKPVARSEVTAAFQAVIEGGTAFDIELPIETAHGREIWVRAHGVADRQDGRIARILGVVQDITERTRLDDLRRLQSAALEATADAIVITDRAGTIIWTNPAFTVLTGYLSAEAIGRDQSALVESGKQPTAVYEAMRRTIVNGHTWEGETINRRKDGSLYTESQVVTPVFDASGSITHFVAIKADITPRLTLEGQLRQALKMETMGQLASAIAHDFNNLLTVINGVGELALADIGEDDPVRADVQEMVRAGERSAELTRQLLAFGRRQVLQPKVIQLNTVVMDTRSLLRRLLGEEIELVFEPSADLGDVRADVGQLEQVIVNLAVNARDAMPRGGRLTVVTRNVVVEAGERIQSSAPVPPGRYVQLSVRDTGVGMDDATLGRIFDPFFTTKPPGAGTGLGLSTVYGIVGQSDGFISVDSIVGQGTTFRILLPRVTVTHVPAVESGPVAKPTSGTETILVVDDTPEVRTLVRRLLESAGYHVLAAATGAEAMQQLERHAGRVRLVVTDVVMPDMGGRGLADRVAETHREVRVLYMSGHTEDTVIQHGVSHATMPFLAKPFSKAALLEKIREVLDTPGYVPVTDAEVLEPLFAHFAGLFPRTCSCGRAYASLAEYIRETTPHGDTISYDATVGDWTPTQPLGALALANCRCGTTLALSTNGLPLAVGHQVLAWIKTEMARRGVTSEVVAGDLREEIRKRALSDSVGLP